MSNAIKDPSKQSSWQMFDRIAKTYDPVNRLLSFGLDIKWRKRVNSLLPQKKNLKLLDLATGTADQVLLLCRINTNIEQAIGMDLSEGMLEKGRIKVKEQGFSKRIELRNGDAVNLPLEDESFDAITMSFGIRNVPNVPKAMEEMVRVLSPGGKSLILEFSMPKNPIVRFGHLFYLRYILPLVGGIISGDFKAYKYLNTSIEAFPDGSDFCTLLSNAGFSSVKHYPVTFGIATIYEASK